MLTGLGSLCSMWPMSGTGWTWTRFLCWVDFVAGDGLIESSDVDRDYDGVGEGMVLVDSIEEDLAWVAVGHLIRYVSERAGD